MGSRSEKERPSRSHGYPDARLVVWLEHVVYEFSALLQALRPLPLTGTSPTELQAVASAFKNCFVEVRALHARNVIEFLTGRRHGQKGDLNAEDYLEHFRVSDEVALRNVYGQACAQVVHVTTGRVTDAEHAAGEGRKDWPPEHFVPVLAETLRFIQALLESRWLQADTPRKAQFQSLQQPLALTIAKLQPSRTADG